MTTLAFFLLMGAFVAALLVVVMAVNDGDDYEPPTLDTRSHGDGR